MRVLLAFAFLLTASSAHAQIATATELRARAAARGWIASEARPYGTPVETWCAAPPCGDADRYELALESGTLVSLRVVLHDAADGFSLDASWQASGAFGFRFVRGGDAVDLASELGYEPPGLDVGFSARDVDQTVALDPDDGAHAYVLWITRELGRYLSSAASLRVTALAQRTALRASVARGIATSATIRQGSFAECMQERAFPNGATGFFEVCPMRMATAEEQRAVLRALDARLRTERTILRAHDRAFHRALTEAIGAP
jgi:hypothetical protein